MSSTDSEDGDFTNNQLLSSTAINSGTNSQAFVISSNNTSTTPSRTTEAAASTSTNRVSNNSTKSADVAIGDGKNSGDGDVNGAKSSKAGGGKGGVGKDDEQKGDARISVTSAGAANSTSQPLDLSQKMKKTADMNNATANKNDLGAPPRGSIETDSERGSANSDAPTNYELFLTSVLHVSVIDCRTEGEGLSNILTYHIKTVEDKFGKYFGYLVRCEEMFCI